MTWAGSAATLQRMLRSRAGTLAGVLLVVGGALAIPALAQPPQPAPPPSAPPAGATSLALPAVLEHAVRQSPSLASARIDVAVAEAGSRRASVLLGGTGGPLAQRVSWPVSGEPLAIVASDMNGDGRLDVVVGDGAGVSVFKNDGSGAFTRLTNTPGRFSPSGLAVADFSADGVPDVAIAEGSATDTVSILHGDREGNLGTSATFVVGTNPTAAAVADFNKDGLPDLGVANNQAKTVSILLGNGIGGFLFVATPTPATP